MKVLVIGGGGREHTLCWKLSQSRKVDKIYCVPGNAGISEIAECQQMEYEKDFSSLVQLVSDEKIDFTVVGPEAPLVNGIVDYFQRRGLAIFGPSKRAAELEGSKVFAKRFMKKYRIPTAQFKVFSDPDKAIKYAREKEGDKVIKADGLSFGKGSLVTETVEEAIEAIELIMREKAFGEAGNRIVVEERLRGKEISFFVLTDGKTIKPLVSSRDHKRIYDGDGGPNTGGMGAYSPAPISSSLYSKILRRIILPTLEGMRREGREYKGVLYVGLMIEKGNPKVLEFNARFGDPETQVTLPRLKNDLLDVLLAVHKGYLSKMNLKWRSHTALCLILASSGYPGKYEMGVEIKGLGNLARMKNIFSFYAGVRREDEKLVTSGGRVLGITALANGLRKAMREAYRAVDKIHFDGMHYRRDIGQACLTKGGRGVK